jgi:Flp pilus assembly protein protease CpaA
MVLEFISLVIALAGSSIAALFDLKTTEIPDEIPDVMIAVGLIFAGVQAYQQWNVWPFLNSAIAGLGLLGFGFVMYHFGQWGGGDAKLLAGIGFLIPQLPSGFIPESFLPFPLVFLFNLFLVGAAYMLIYAVIFAMMNKKIILEFEKGMKAISKHLLLFSIFLLVLFVFFNLYLSKTFHTPMTAYQLLLNSFIPFVGTIALFMVWKFAKIVEGVGFKKRIPISKLRIGDVMLESKLWEGITEKELKKIKKSGKRYVVIKEGVRFGPSFPLALIFTLYFGNGMLLLMNFLI